MNPKLISTLFAIAFITYTTPLFCGDEKTVSPDDQLCSYKTRDGKWAPKWGPRPQLPNPNWLQERMDFTAEVLKRKIPDEDLQNDPQALADHFKSLTSIEDLRSCPDSEFRDHAETIIGILYANVLNLRERLKSVEKNLGGHLCRSHTPEKRCFIDR